MRVMDDNMKIVINTCYGGFGISREALYELIKMNSPLIKKIPLKEYFKDSLSEIDDFSIPFKEMKAHPFYEFPLIDDKYAYFLDSDIPELILRTHSDLIAVVEKLEEKANGKHASLKIVEVPDDINWILFDYDGYEWIMEAGRFITECPLPYYRKEEVIE